MANIGAIGNKGLVIFDGDNYYFMTESQVREAKAPAGSGGASVDVRPMLVGVLDAGKTLFVDADGINKTDFVDSDDEDDEDQGEDEDS